MSDTSTPPSDPDPTLLPQPATPMYRVDGAPRDRDEFTGLLLPRRPAAGARGILLYEPVGTDEYVHLLDADDDAEVFRYREVRPISGSTTDLSYPPGGGDHIIRAVYEHDYDVISAPWFGAPARTRKGRS